MTFDEHVRRALDSVPPELAKALENVAVVVEDENPEDPDLFGLYHGVPLPDRGSSYAGQLPDKISIYRGPITRMARTPERIREQVRRTVIHEIAHHFGIDDARLHELGWA